MNPNFNRRQFIGLAVCVAVNTALTGCKKKEPEWTVEKDDKLKPLAFEISEGKATPLSGSGWKRCDDYIHLQLSGSSIPDRKIAKVKQKRERSSSMSIMATVKFSRWILCLPNIRSPAGIFPRSSISSSTRMEPGLKFSMPTVPAVWIADLNRQYIDMKKGRSTSPLFHLLHKFRSISKQ